MKLPKLHIRGLFWLVLALSCSGCMPGLDNAVADKDHFTIDARLLGDYSHFRMTKVTIRFLDTEKGIYELVDDDEH